MDNVPWPNFRDAQTQRLAAEFLKRSSGKAFDTSGYTYEAVRVIADVLERARSTDPDTLVDAIKKTNYSSHLMVANGPIRFDEGGDNPNVGTAMIQILDQKPPLVWPKAVADEKFVFPRPKRWCRPTLSCYHSDITEVVMPQVLVRDLDAAVIRKLKSRARGHGRSLQAELKDILQQAADNHGMDVMARVREVRAMFRGRKFSDSAALIRRDRLR